MSTAAGMISDERLEVNDALAAAEAAMRLIDAHLAARGEREKHLHMPARIAGECTGDHLRRGAPLWTEMPDEPPLGEEGGTAWTPDNLWLREEAEEPVTP